MNFEKEEIIKSLEICGDLNLETCEGCIFYQAEECCHKLAQEVLKIL